jgi:hypothetical protein
MAAPSAAGQTKLRPQPGEPTPPAGEAQSETSVYRALYRSNAGKRFSNHELLEEARSFNRAPREGDAAL